MEKARVRYATIGDAEHVGQLMTELGYPTTVDAMKERLAMILADPRYVTFVADTGRCVIGVAGATLGRYYEKDGTYSHLLVLAVSSEARGHGAGTQLVDAVEDWAVRNGARTVVVNSALHRSGAHGFYERRGYSRTSFRFVKQLNQGE